MNNKQNQIGLSLIELLIAISIGVLILLAATSLFISNKRIYKENDDMSRIQENGQFALKLLTNDIRMTNYRGCADIDESLKNGIPNSSNDTFLDSYRYSIEGIEALTLNTQTWVPSGSREGFYAPGASNNPIAPNYVPNLINAVESDAITLRYIEPVPSEIIFKPGAAMLTQSDDIPVTCGNGISCSSIVQQGERLAISDCEVGDLFMVGGVGVGAQSTINPVNQLSKAYNDKAQISRYRVARYFVAESSSQDVQRDGNIKIPSLWRYTNVRDVKLLQEVVQGVEKMSFLYGVDTDGDRVINKFVKANDSYLSTEEAWLTVRAIRIMLLLRSINPNFHIEEDRSTYQLLNDTLYSPPPQPVRRKIFSSTVQIYNNS